MKAIVIGSTGMVGTQLINQLVDSEDYSEVISLVRRKTEMVHPKLTEIVVDFDRSEQWSGIVTGDVLFSTMGTTLATAGSKENQYKVDFTYQYQTAEAAAKNGVKTCVLVSAAGASAKSPVFYSKMKGELDEAVEKLGFEQLVILRPGQLWGDRKEKRSSEKMALKVMFALNKMGLFRKYKPIHASEVAKVMLALVKTKRSGIFVLDELFFL